MEHWDLRTMEVEPHHPVVLHSNQEGRAIVLHLPAGEALDEHEVHERAWLAVMAGEVEVDVGGTAMRARPGFLGVFAPHERREVRATADARLLYVLSPWPGEGRQFG